MNQNRDAPTPITNMAPRAKCLSSVRLNQKTSAGRALRGAMGSTYLSRLGEGPSTMIGRSSSRGIFALQYSGHAWFSGSRCSTQKYPWQKGHLKGRKSSFPQCWHFTFLWLPGWSKFSLKAFLKILWLYKPYVGKGTSNLESRNKSNNFHFTFCSYDKLERLTGWTGKMQIIRKENCRKTYAFNLTSF